MKTVSEAFSARLLTLAQQHVPRLTIRGQKGSGLCCFHDEKTPSLSFDFSKGVYYCHGCGKGGGVKDFALAVGESWGTTCYNTRERARFAVQARRRKAEEQARAILANRLETQHKALCFENHAAINEANDAAELLAFFHRHSNLAEEFSELVTRTEQEYSDALFKQTVLEAQLQGEVEVEG